MQNVRAVSNGPPPGYQPETTTVWSFPERGSWASHDGRYRGNWSPYVPRNLILKYTQPGDLVLDPMMGGGTTLVEAKLLGRNGIGIDVNHRAVSLATERVERAVASPAVPLASIKLHLGNARDLSRIPDDAVDLVATHPPYADIIRYSDGQIADDLSSTNQIGDFLIALQDVARECYRVLAPGKHCAVLMGGTRKHGHYVPFADMTLIQFLQAGFLVREEIIKLQWNVSSERERWTTPKHDFYKIAHERLFVFRKPFGPEDRDRHRWSQTLSPTPAKS
jgi:DNA modification methylase